MRRYKIPILFTIVLIATLLIPALPASAWGSRYFPQTGFTVQGAFLDFFDRYGGLSTFGYPLTNEYLEGGTTMQYFERARFEWHPWNPDPFKVELSLLGTMVRGAVDPPVGPQPWRWDLRYFPETGHNVSGAFLNAFNTRGGLTIFGYPISEPYYIAGNVLIQYFQRARMEQYPGQYHVALGAVGSEWLNHTPGPGPQPTPPARSRFFPETGYSVQSGFLDYWETHGQLDVFGYPISGEFSQNGVTVQYFQRARMEWRPSNPPAYRVQLGLLGSELHGPTDPPVPNWVTPWNSRARYFPATGHIVTEGFLEFFDVHGGLDIFGYPIGEAQMEGGMVVQWFQRAKMEWHPANPPQWRVQLALLGSIIYGGSPPGPAKWEPIEGFGKVWRDNPTVRNGLGYGVEQQHTTGSTEQTMQGGVFFWRQDTRTIYAMRNDGTWAAFNDTWESWRDPERWSYIPPAGLHEAIRGFGKVWREQLGGPSGSFGWGVDAEWGFTGKVQAFERGLMLENDRREIFVLFNNGTWQKYQDLS
jgi:hypothetical protein